MKRRWFRRAGLTAALLVGMLWSMGAQAQPARSPELNIQYHRAEMAWKSGASLLEAKARVDRVLAALPDDTEARKLRARILLRMGRYRAALRDARRAVNLAPDDAEAHLIHCEAARLSGRLEEAEKALEAAGERALDGVDFHVRLSWNAIQLEQYDRAEAYARIALAQSPPRPAAFYQMARVFVLKARMDEAARVLARGFARGLLDPAVVRADTTLARLAGHPLLKDWF